MYKYIINILVILFEKITNIFIESNIWFCDELSSSEEHIVTTFSYFYPHLQRI